MSISFFSDKSRPPSMNEVLDIIGSRRPLWEALANFVVGGYRAEPGFKNYGKSYGWMVWFRKGGKNLLSLYPKKGGFVAQIILGPTILDRALELPLDPKILKAIQDAHPYPEGRWIRVDVESEREVADIQQLMRLKAQPTKR